MPEKAATEPSSYIQGIYIIVINKVDQFNKNIYHLLIYYYLYFFKKKNKNQKLKISSIG